VLFCYIEEKTVTTCPFLREEKSSKRKEFDDNLQERVEYLEKKLQELENKLEERLEATSHGRKMELKETEEKRFEDSGGRKPKWTFRFTA
jgi:hypothetical protein